MGLFGGKSEDDLRASGTPTTARVTYVDDTGKRREDGRQAKLKVRVQLESGSARGREMDQEKWVPADRPPRVGEHVQIRFDPDHIDDWAWGDPAMYGLAAPAQAPAPTPAAPVPTPAAPAAPVIPAMPGFQAGGFDMTQIQDMIATAFEQGNVTFESVSQVFDATGAAAPAPSPDALADRLRRVDDLLKSGVLTEAEHREQRQRIIDSI
ncbi:MAG: hypothetical protein QOJ12_1351 [Thermoleophilales bacterium]|nr:hypothetical protein [Thermoleophilales bacterium]